jgi:tetratricopeptide (TPR) repeat protein
MSALVNGALGNHEERARWVADLENQTEATGTYEHLLRINYHDAIRILAKGQHKKAKPLLAKSIRMASRNREYRSLCTMYYATSGVFYEEGNYPKALKYLEKAIRLGTELGMSDHVGAYKVHQASNYRELGRYGTAIRHLKSLLSMLPSARAFFAELIIFDIYTRLNSDQADLRAESLSQAVEQIQPGMTLGFYHQLLGNLFFVRNEYRAALEQQRTACTVYEQAGSEDDWLKTKIAMARTLIADSNISAAREVMDELSERVSRHEAPAIAAGE